MGIDEFRKSLDASAPPAGLDQALQGLWWDVKGDWERAHASAQDQDDARGAWVHAYLHRKEGDQGNAAYWYRRAGKPHCVATLDEEWTEIAAALIGRQS